MNATSKPGVDRQAVGDENSPIGHLPESAIESRSQLVGHAAALGEARREGPAENAVGAVLRLCRTGFLPIETGFARFRLRVSGGV